MTIKTLVSKSFEKNIIVHCSNYSEAKYFLTTFWYNYYDVTPEDNDESKNKCMAKSAVTSILYGYARFGSDTCYNIKNGYLNTISLNFIDKYGLNYDYDLMNNKDIQRTELCI